MSSPRKKYQLWFAIALPVVTELLFWAALALVIYVVLPYMPTLEFQHREWWWMLLILPLVSLSFAVRVWRKNSTLSLLAEDALREKVVLDISTVRAALRYLAFRLALASFMIAALGPRFGSKLEEIQTKGIDLMIALDVSNSMLAEDVSPNRLSKAKMAIEKMLDRLRGDRIGLVAFAGNAFVQMPITSDYDATRLFLQNLDTRSASVQGTSIGNAIRLCIDSFDPKSPANKAIVVITDGEDHENDALEAARFASDEHQISVFTVGVGTPDGTLIPDINEEGQQTGFKTDASGRSVVSRLNEEALSEIAKAGNGSFSRMTTSIAPLESLVVNLTKIEKTELGKREFADYEYRYGLFVLLGIALLLAEQLIAEKKGTWTSYLNLIE
ncbi:MAG: VWA domain-containing protein [Flavobacteriales bacterium]|nr:VWA domain-containing protein [Flavobacteriales bacterium]